MPLFSKANTDEMMIAITLDECSGATITNEFMEAAYSHGAKLTLFPTGENVMKTGMDEVLQNELTSLATYGAHHTMGNISGNHDQIRFASIAGGAIDIHSQGKEEGWTSEIGIGVGRLCYQKA